MIRTIAGIIFIAMGLVSLLSIVAGFRGSAFAVISKLMQGLGGSLCLGIPLFLIWTGVLFSFSAHRSMPVRGILLVFGFYLCILNIITLLSKVGVMTLLEYAAERNKNPQTLLPDPEGFQSVLQSVYAICYQNGMFAGALGVLLAWPLATFTGVTVGVVVLVAACLVFVLCFSQFDVVRWAREWKLRTDELLEKWDKQKQQKAYEEAMQKQQELAEKRQLPAYMRRGEQVVGPDGIPVMVYPPQVPGMPVMVPVDPSMVPQVFPVPGMPQPMGSTTMMTPPPGLPIYPPREVQLYDEVIVPESPVKPRGWFGRSKEKTARAERAPFVPPASPPSAGIPLEELPPKESLDRVTRKAVERLEEIRRRQAELAQSIFQDESGGVAMPPVPGMTAQPLMGNPFAPPTKAAPVVQAPKAAPFAPPQKAAPATFAPPMATQKTVTMSGVRLDTPEIILPEGAGKREQELSASQQEYVYPTLDLLNPQVAQVKDFREQDTKNAAKLEKTLESFGIPARVQRVTHGPAVTRFELGLVSSGINVKRILSIADNIALEMAANGGVRIEIPIPGTNLFGIEVPNKEIVSVSLMEVLVSDEMTSAKSPLTVALGRDIAGTPIICDLAKMPHLLIAGQTGSGKSVCINTIINSLLFRSSPEQVRMIMIDPKVVELQCYNAAPHLLIPVVSDPHKAAGALAWAVAEMLDRYHKMQSKNVRELNAYNAKIGAGEEKLPRIVIVIDELADLMLACKKDVEESIIRLAQLARAAGIHMIVATQRPTVDVITGLIKANIPSRIAFAVSSSIDSRTILDANGAEKLLGKGDMFYFPTGASAPLRVQGCFLTDGEIERVMDYISAHTSVEFDENILEAMEASNEPTTGLDDMSDGGVDDKLAEAIEMVIADGQASISMLQRRMKIGYARAGRLIDDMAARGVVSKSAGSKPREVLMTREEYERMRDNLLM